MKQLCCDSSPETCERLKALLALHGIACVVRPGGDAPLFDGRAAPLAELWVEDDAQAEAAWAVLNAPPPAEEEPAD